MSTAAHTNGEPFDFYAEAAKTNGASNDGTAKDTKKSKPQLKALTPADVLSRWKTSGPLIHEPTGFRTLDERTGGGFVYGSRVYVLGAPDAGKTLFIVQLGDLWARKGVAVGKLAVDEEDDDMTTRLVQRIVLPSAPGVDLEDIDLSAPPPRERFTRQDCEERAPEVVEEMQKAMGDPPIRFYDADWTIEAAAEDLATFAKSRGIRRMALFIDSIQTVTCDALADLLDKGREPQPRELITANVRAVRSVASEYRMLLVATSEMNRNAYRDMDASDEANDMVAGKESGAIEYSGRVLVSMRSVKDEPERIEVRLPKNKHGPSWRSKDDSFYLCIDRANQTLADAEAIAQETKEQKDERVQKVKFEKEERAMIKVLRAHPAGLVTGVLQAALRNELGGAMRNGTELAIAMRLGAAIEHGPAPKPAHHLAKLYRLVPEHLPERLRKD